MENIAFDKNIVILKNEDYFNIAGSLDCGQAFRWNELNGKMRGVVCGRLLYVYRNGNDVIIEGSNKDFFESFLRNYFDLDFDYKGLLEKYKDDKRIYEGANLEYGLRMLNQEPFETLISFIISANNNVKRIKGIIERICRAYGAKIAEDAYAFPSAEELKDVKEKDYAALGAGYRAAYLEATVKAINDGYDLNALKKLDYKAARKEIQRLKGVGPKVADCILLYGFSYKDAFPIDVWVKRIMEQLYFNGKETAKKDIEAFSNANFGENAGVLQLFLFNYARKMKI